MSGVNLRKTLLKALKESFPFLENCGERGCFQAITDGLLSAKAYEFVANTLVVVISPHISIVEA